jgi:hypothetical protein
MAFHPRREEWPTEAGIFPAQPMESGDDFFHVTYTHPPHPFQTVNIYTHHRGSATCHEASTTFLKATPVGLISWKKRRNRWQPQWAAFWRYLLIYPLPSCTFVGWNLNRWKRGGVEDWGFRVSLCWLPTTTTY